MTNPDDQFEITAHPQNAAAARDRVSRVAAAAGVSRASLNDIQIAVGEAVTNAILYGSPTATSRIVISSRYRADIATFTVEIQDQGRGFDPEQIRTDDDTDLLGGRGIRLMRALMDAVILEYTENGMAVRLDKKNL